MFQLHQYKSLCFPFTIYKKNILLKCQKCSIYLNQKNYAKCLFCEFSITKRNLKKWTCTQFINAKFVIIINVQNANQFQVLWEMMQLNDVILVKKENKINISTQNIQSNKQYFQRQDTFYSVLGMLFRHCLPVINFDKLQLMIRTYILFKEIELISTSIKSSQLKYFYLSNSCNCFLLQHLTMKKIILMEGIMIL
ncbi:unnamed protein product [Paramecium sonneborni]|uniref:Uncharacterized protein n=1 Tax=Paramecium sonneborni TaxID=65129 RepID=A0A8S1RQZ4_9CILI|nr:unnamed protein product [Paramecium sonneborni]